MPVNTHKQRVLDHIKFRGPISAVQIGFDQGCTEKQARSAIDRLRALESPIWNDPARQAFWWSDEYPLGDGWKRHSVRGENKSSALES